MSDNIIVRWESEDGWREGVLCVVMTNHETITRTGNMRDAVSGGRFGTAVIWDRHRNERCIVRLGKVRLIPPRCQKCDGEGVLDAVATTGNGQGAVYRCKTTCECQK